MRVRPIFAWYDLWVGVFVDRAKRRVYVFPLPCIGVVAEWGSPVEDEKTRLREALECIADDRGLCENYTGPYTCRGAGSGRTRGAYYGAEAWCDTCIARDALGWTP